MKNRILPIFTIIGLTLTLIVLTPQKTQAVPASCYVTAFGSLNVTVSQTSALFTWRTKDPRTTRIDIRKQGQSTWDTIGTNYGAQVDPNEYTTNHTVNTVDTWKISVSPPTRGYPLTPGTIYNYVVYGINWGISGTYQCARTTQRSLTTLSPPPPQPPSPPPAPPPTPEPESGGDDGSSWVDPGSVDDTSSDDLIAQVGEDKQPPTEPAGLKADYSTERNTIDLSWDSSSDDNLEGYEIERTEKAKDSWKKVGESDTESYTDFEFAPNTAYEYRVRAFDASKNYSLYSNVAEVLSGEFTPNVTIKEGGTVQSEDGLAIVEFPSQAVSEDIFVSIEKTNEQEFEIEKDDAIAGNIYNIQAKTHRGEEPQSFKTQIPITLKFSKKDIRNVNPSTLRITRFNSESVADLQTTIDTNAGEAKTLTDHFSQYFLVAKKGNSYATFLRILMWLLIIAGIAAGGYFGWQWWQRRQYQEAHREDYIYKH